MPIPCLPISLSLPGFLECEKLPGRGQAEAVTRGTAAKFCLLCSDLFWSLATQWIQASNKEGRSLSQAWVHELFLDDGELHICADFQHFPSCSVHSASSYRKTPTGEFFSPLSFLCFPGHAESQTLT